MVVARQAVCIHGAVGIMCGISVLWRTVVRVICQMGGKRDPRIRGSQVIMLPARVTMCTSTMVEVQLATGMPTKGEGFFILPRMIRIMKLVQLAVSLQRLQMAFPTQLLSVK